MTNKPPKQITPSNGGFFEEISIQFKLIWRLMGDKRVNFFLKLIPVASVAYLISPIDLLPTIPIDDFGVIGLALYMFVEFCPQDIVEEHKQKIRNIIPAEWKDAPPEDVVDGEFIDAEEHKPSGE